MREKKPGDVAPSGASGVIRRRPASAPGKRTLTEGLVPSAPSGGGAALDASVRAPIERTVGADLGHVRVHSGDEAQTSAAGIGARAFTMGNDIFLGHGESATDLRLMAHEATHVVQQGGGPSGPQAKAQVGRVDDPAEHEADAVAERVVAGQTAGPISADTTGVARRTAAPNPSTDGTDAAGKPVEVQDGEAFIKGDKDKDEIDPSDVEQGQLGDCWLLAGLQALARSNPEAIRKMIKPVGPGKWSVTFQFPKDGGYAAETVVVDAAVPVTAKGGAPLFAKVGDVKDGKKELWVLLIEKAYATTQGKYNNITGANSPADHQSMEMVTGKKDGTLDPAATSEDDIAAKLALALSEKKGVTLWTVTKDHANAKDADANKPRIVTNHGYTLNNVDKDKKTVDLLNPWGADYAITGLEISKVKKFFRQIRIGG